MLPSCRLQACFKIHENAPIDICIWTRPSPTSVYVHVLGGSCQQKGKHKLQPHPNPRHMTPTTASTRGSVSRVGWGWSKPRMPTPYTLPYHQSTERPKDQPCCNPKHPPLSRHMLPYDLLLSMDYACHTQQQYLPIKSDPTSKNYMLPHHPFSRRVGSGGMLWTLNPLHCTL
jgi:hypothetical protein